MKHSVQEVVQAKTHVIKLISIQGLIMRITGPTTVAHAEMIVRIHKFKGNSKLTMKIF